jgi:hypothetical protein
MKSEFTFKITVKNFDVSFAEFCRNPWAVFFDSSLNYDVKLSFRGHGDLRLKFNQYPQPDRFARWVQLVYWRSGRIKGGDCSPPRYI